MENPCSKCIVLSMCAEICPPKEDYGRQVKIGYNNYARSIVSGKRKIKQTNDLFDLYTNLLQEHRTDLSRIIDRSRQRR